MGASEVVSAYGAARDRTPSRPGRAHGAAVVDGSDVGALDGGRIRRIVGSFGPFPPPEGG